MARYVMLVKEQEDETDVIYRFGPDEDHLGRLRLDKATGMVYEVDPVPGVDPQKSFMPAATKIRQHWKRGTFPERTSWSS